MIVLIWIGRVLLALIALLVLILLLPVCLRFDYTPDAATLQLRFLFFRLELLPLLQKKQAAPKQKSKNGGSTRQRHVKKIKKPQRKPEKPSPAAAQQSSDTQNRQTEKEHQRSVTQKKRPGAQKQHRTEKPDPAQYKKVMAVLQNLSQLLQTAGAFLRAVLRALSFRRISFFIPIHEEDAARTARSVGTAYAALSALAAALHGLLRLHWGSTVFCPDYRDEFADRLHLSGRVYGQLLPLLIALLTLLLRLEKQQLLPRDADIPA